MADENENGEGTGGTSESGAGGASSGGNPPEGYVPQTEFEAAEARRRSFQSENDRLKAENEALRRAGAPAPTEPPSTGITMEQLRAEMARSSALSEAKAKVSQTYGLARPEVLNANYGTAEEYIAAAARSHEAEKAYQAKIAEDAQAKLKADLVAANPGLASVFAPAPQAPPNGGEGGKAKITPEDWAKLPHREKMAYSDADLQAVFSS